MNNKSFIGILTLFCAMLWTKSGYAQWDRRLYDSIAGALQVNYNLKQAEKIYIMTSVVFRLKMSEAQFTLGMSKFYAKAGNWSKYTFAESNEKGLDYMAEFENSRQLFSLKLDNQGKIIRLNFASVPVVIATKKDQVPSNNPLKDYLDFLVERMVRPYIQKGNTSGLVLAIMDKARIRKYSYGTVNKEKKQLPDAENTIFEIGSVTKTFTSLLLTRELVSGRMKLDDPINWYLPDSIPDLSFNGRPITLKHLANHTSGFPRLPANIFKGKVNASDPYKHYLPDSLYSFLKGYRPVVMPGTVFSYSNFGAGVLGTLLEREEKTSFEQLVLKEICKPLGMAHTTVTLSGVAQKNFAQGYNEKGEITAPWDLAALKGSGAVRSTLNDMIKYLRAQMGGNNPLKKSIILTQQITFKSAAETMGLGWRINMAGKNTYLHHSGGTGGFRSFVGFDPDRQFGIVILSNTAEDVTAIGESFFW